MKKKMSLAVAAAVIGMSAGAGAQGIYSDTGFGAEVGLGWYWPDSDFDLEDGSMWGVGLEYRIDEHWAIQGWYLKSENFDSKNDDGDLTISIGDGDVENFFGALTYYFSNGSWQPYVSIGGGQARYDYDRGSQDLSQFNAGVGVKWHITPGFFLRGEGRLYTGQGNIDTSVLLTLGYLFGQHAKAAPVLDSDGDGVMDDVDACPNTEYGVDVDSSGCPVGAGMDSDNDGVADNVDQCPQTIVGALVDETGCGYQLTGAHFKFDSAELNLDADTILNEVAERMEENPGFSLTVGGHTDSVGDENYNVDLSERRAQAVVDYLTARGVDASRLNPVGFGSSMPVASNDTAEGRAENRRVVFVRD